MLVIPSLLGLPAFAHADINDTFTPYVAANYIYNDNLFLLPNEQTALTNLGRTRMSESYQTYAAGINLYKPISRQIISGHIEINRTNFDTYTNMNYTGRDLLFNWDWVIQDAIRGDAGVADTLSLAPFIYTKTPLANLVSTRRYYADSYFRIHDRWSFKLGAEKLHSTNSDATQQFNNADIDTYKTGLRYITPKESKIEFTSLMSRGQYPGQTNSFNTFNQYDNGIDFDWKATGKTNLIGRAYFTKRDYPNASQQNFTGATGAITANWAATGKTSISLGLYRNIGSYITSTSNYQVTQGVLASAIWLATSTVTTTLTARWENVDYLNTPRQTDDVSTLGLGITYMVLRNTRLNLNLQHGERNSNIASQSYRYNSLLVGLNSSF